MNCGAKVFNKDQNAEKVFVHDLENIGDRCGANCRHFLRNFLSGLFLVKYNP